MKERKKRFMKPVVIGLLLFCLGSFQSLYCSAIRETEIMEPVSIDGPLTWKSERGLEIIKYEIVLPKRSALKNLTFLYDRREITLRRIVNLDIHSLRPPDRTRYPVHELIKRGMPPIKVTLKLSSPGSRLFFWEPKGPGGEWLPARGYVVDGTNYAEIIDKSKDENVIITNWNKRGSIVSFEIIKWPEADRDMGDT